MAETPTTVTFTLTNPDGTVVRGGKATFSLSGYDIDAGFVVPTMVEVPIELDGTGSVDLWPNTGGLTNSLYAVNFTPTFGGKTVALSNIAVPESATPVALHTLAVTKIGTLTAIVLTQAEYDALTTKDPAKLYLIRAEA